MECREFYLILLYILLANTCAGKHGVLILLIGQ